MSLGLEYIFSVESISIDFSIFKKKAVLFRYSQQLGCMLLCDDDNAVIFLEFMNQVFYFGSG